MSKTSTPHGSNGGDVSPTEKNTVVEIHAGMKKILMAALSRVDQIRNSKDLQEFVSEIGEEMKSLHERTSLEKVGKA